MVRRRRFAHSPCLLQPALLPRGGGPQAAAPLSAEYSPHWRRCLLSCRLDIFVLCQHDETCAAAKCACGSKQKAMDEV